MNTKKRRLKRRAERDERNRAMGFDDLLVVNCFCRSESLPLHEALKLEDDCPECVTPRTMAGLLLRRVKADMQAEEDKFLAGHPGPGLISVGFRME